MTEDEIKQLEAAETGVVVEQDAPKPQAAEDEVAKRLQAQAKAAEETAAAERKAREAAEHRAREAEQEASRYQTAAQSSHITAIDAEIAAATRQRETAQRDYQAAMESGDYAKSGDAQARIAEVAAEISQLKRDKAQAERERPAPQQERPQPQQWVDPNEAFIAQFAPRMQTWLRQNKDQMVNNGQTIAFSPKAMEAHYGALANGALEGSDAYFNFIDGRLNPPVQQQQEDTIDVAPAPRKSAPIAAPVTREPVSSSSNPGRSTRMSLTKEQSEIAIMSGDPKKTPREREIDYWTNLQSLKAEGKVA